MIIATTPSTLTNHTTKLTTITIIISNHPRDTIGPIHSPNTYNKVDIIINIIVDIIAASYAIIRNALYTRGLVISLYNTYLRSAGSLNSSTAHTSKTMALIMIIKPSLLALKK